jgi:hypothetical protein
MDNKDSAKRVDPKGKVAKGEAKDEKEGNGRSRQGMIDRATEPEWYGVTSF